MLILKGHFWFTSLEVTFLLLVDMNDGIVSYIQTSALELLHLVDVDELASTDTQTDKMTNAEEF